MNIFQFVQNFKTNKNFRTMAQKTNNTPLNTNKASLLGSILSQNQLPPNLAITTLNGVPKTSVPIKQYSNKFFRDPINEPHLASTQSQTPQMNKNRRANTLIRKKQLFGKQASLRQNKYRAESFNKHRELLSVNCEQKSRERIKTQACKSVACTSHAESSIIQLQNELVIESQLAVLPTQTLISPCPSHFFHRNTEPFPTSTQKQLEGLIKQLQPSKISHSRALELFSKVYKKEKSFVIEKKESPRKAKKAVAKQVSTPNNENQHFQTKKIFPIEKNGKKQHLLRYLDKKQRMIRTPMSLINNRIPRANPLLESVKNTIQNQEQEEEEFYELKGWDTTL